MSRSPGVVAELGRPETPDETAARKAASSRKHRENQTLFNLITATVVCLGLVLIMVLIVVRPASPPAPAIDYQALAAESSTTLGSAALAPGLPAGWSANAARLGTASDGTRTWYVGFITPDNRFIAMLQAAHAEPAWLMVEEATNFRGGATGALAIEGLRWEEHDRRSVENAGNFEYVLTTRGSTDTVILYGNGSADEFRVLATALAAGIGSPTETSE